MSYDQQEMKKATRKCSRNVLKVRGKQKKVQVLCLLGKREEMNNREKIEVVSASVFTKIKKLSVTGYLGWVTKGQEYMLE